MKTVITAVAVATLLFLISVPSNACSVAGCLNDGVEANQYFTMTFKHHGKPLAGVLVEITGDGKEQFSGLTSTDGKVRLNLSPGHYWLKAELLGISAAYDCFHINQQSSKSAKRKFTFEWGDLSRQPDELQASWLTRSLEKIKMGLLSGTFYIALTYRSPALV